MESPPTLPPSSKLESINDGRDRCNPPRLGKPRTMTGILFDLKNDVLSTVELLNALKQMLQGDQPWERGFQLSIGEWKGLYRVLVTAQKHAGRVTAGWETS